MRILIRLRWSIQVRMIALICGVLLAMSVATHVVYADEPWQTQTLQGQIVSLDGSTLGLQTPDGSVYEIEMEPYAQIVAAKSAVQREAVLAVGQQVTVRALRDEAGQIRTGYVRIATATAPATPSGLAGELLSQSAADAPRCGGGSSDWPMLGQNTNHSFFNAAEQKLWPPLNMYWSFPGKWNLSTPAVVGDVAYLGAYDGFYALHLGVKQVLWGRRTDSFGGTLIGDNDLSSPAVVDNRIYFGTWAGYVYSLDRQSGEVMWGTSIIPRSYWPTVHSPVIYGNQLFITAEYWDIANLRWRQSVYALDRTNGSLLWQLDISMKEEEVGVISDPVYADGRIFVASTVDGVYAIDASTGALLWQQPAPAETNTALVNFDGYLHVDGGRVYVLYDLGEYAEYQDRLYAFDTALGTVLWQYNPPAPQTLFGSSLMLTDGAIYGFVLAAGDTANKYLVGIDSATGQEIKRIHYTDSGEDAGWWWLSGANGVMYRVSAAGSLVAFDIAQGGEAIWQYTPQTSVEIPAVPANGRLLVIDGKSNLYVFSTSCAEATPTPTPSPTATSTATPTPTFTNTPTPTPTFTPTPFCVNEPWSVSLSGLPAGTVLNAQVPGLVIWAQNNRSNHPHKALIFDSSRPTGDDYDLGTPNQEFGGPGVGTGGRAGQPFANSKPLGNLIVIAENDADANGDGRVDNPDDEGAGGKLFFEFTNPQDLETLHVVDVDGGEVGGYIRLYNPANTLLNTVSIVSTGDNGVQAVDVKVRNVKRIELELVGSGAFHTFRTCQIIAPFTPTPTVPPTLTPTPAATPNPEQLPDPAACYGVADSTTTRLDGAQLDTLTFLNRFTGATSSVNGQIGNTGTFNIEAVAFQPGSLILYAADADQLGTLNLRTGAFTRRSSTFGSGRGYIDGRTQLTTITMSDVDGLSFNSLTNDLYGTARRDGRDVLFRIDASSGRLVPNSFPDPYRAGQHVDFVEVGAIGNLDDVDDMSFDPITGTLYGAINEGSNTTVKLVTINVSNGAITVVGDILDSRGRMIQDVEGLSFFNDGGLYASTGKEGPTINGLYLVNKYTAEATVIGQFTEPLRDFEGTACLTALGVPPTPPPPPPPPTATPNATPDVNQLPNPDACYGVADSTVSANDGSQLDTLTFLNRLTGATQSVNGRIGNTGTYNIESVAFQPNSVTLYAADGGRLGRLNLNTGAFTPVGQGFGTARGYIDGSTRLSSINLNDIDSLSFNPLNFDLYGTHRRTGQDLLFRINVATGAFVPNAFPDPYQPGRYVDFVEVDGVNNLNDVDDIAFDPITGALYGAINEGSDTLSKLVVIDETSGDIVVLGDFVDSGRRMVQDIEGLSFFNDGVLYASTGKSGPTTNGLYRVDKFTGMVTLVGQFTEPLRDFEGSDCLTATGYVPPAQPTPVVCYAPAPSSCELYPIALHSQSLQGIAVGQTLIDIFNGVQPGNFGWLTWQGSPNVPTLVTSLTSPGDSNTYVNPHFAADRTISIGDWVQGSPGVANASNVRAALDALQRRDIVVPVWDQAQGQGNNSLYRVANFARVRITDYRLPNQNRISATFLGYAECGVTSAPPAGVPMCVAPPTPTPSPTPAVVAAGGHTISFIGVRYDHPQAGQSTWYYTVTSGRRPSISYVNFNLNLTQEGGPHQVVGGTNGAGIWVANQNDRRPGMGNPFIGNDNVMNINGLQFGQSFDDQESRNYYFTLDKNYSVGQIQVGIRDRRQQYRPTIFGPGTTVIPTPTPTPTQTSTPVATSTPIASSTPTRLPSTPISGSIDGCAIAPLGMASDYNLFLLNDLFRSYTDAQGRVAVGRNAVLTGFGIGVSLPNSFGSRHDLIVGGNLNYSNGQVHRGSIIYGGSAVIQQNVGVPNGSVRQGQALDFAMARTELPLLSAQLARMSANGLVNFQSGILTLTGSNSKQNIFLVDGAFLNAANTLRINVPAGSTALINVSGTTVNFQFMGMFINNNNSAAPPGQERVLFNFHQATTLNVSGMGVKGSILAPLAVANFSNGHINGSFIASSMANGYGEAHHYPFVGCVPSLQATPTPTPLPTNTPVPTNTPTFTPTPTFTHTPTPTHTPTFTPTPTPTFTPITPQVSPTPVGPAEFCVGPNPITFQGLPAGTIVNEQIAGVSVRAENERSGHPDLAIIFNSSNPTGDDADLGAPNEDFGGPGKGAGGRSGQPGENNAALGNILIVAENDIDTNMDGLIDVPDDEAAGGRIYFEFSDPQDITSIYVIDVETGGGVIRAFNEDSELISSVNIESLGDNAVQEVFLDVQDVHWIEVEFATSGGIYGLCPTSNDPPSQPPYTENPRVDHGLQALYTFNEGNGGVIYDVSGVGTALNLVIANPSQVQWIAGGLDVNGATLIATEGAATKLINAVSWNSAFTFEAWVVPPAAMAATSGVIAALEKDSTDRNFSFWQQSGSYHMALKSSATTLDGQPALSSPANSVEAKLVQLVYTREASGETRLFINGVPVAEATTEGLITNWDNSFRLSIGNNLSGNSLWDGQYHLLAIYNRALSLGEIYQNLDAGVDDANIGTPIVMESNPTALVADGRSTSHLSLVVQDAYGNPLPNKLVSFQTTLGSISPVTVTTDAQGRAESVLTAGLQLGRAKITALTDVSRGTVYVNIVEGASAVILPNADSTLQYLAPDGNGSTKIEIPAGSVTMETNLHYAAMTTVNAWQPDFIFGGRGFSLDAYQNGQPQDHFTFNKPIRVTIQYTADEAEGLDENELILPFWDGKLWIDAATSCTPTSEYIRNPAQNTFSVEICHLTEFSMFGLPSSNFSLYLPAALRNNRGAGEQVEAVQKLYLPAIER